MEFEDAYTFPRNTLTAYRSRSGVGDFYSLETLLVWLRHGVTTDAATGAVHKLHTKSISRARVHAAPPLLQYLQQVRVTELE